MAAVPGLDEWRRHVCQKHRRSVRASEPVLWLTAATTATPSSIVSLAQTDVQIHIYQTAPDSSVEEFSAGLGDEEGEEQVVAASVLELPSESVEGVWER